MRHLGTRAAVKRPNKYFEGAKSNGLKTSGGGGAPLNVKAFCESYQVSQEAFTRLTGFSPRAVANWASGRKPSDSTERRLTEFKRIFDALAKLVSAEAIGPWLKQPNQAFDGSTPLQVIERGEADRIWRMIY